MRGVVIACGCIDVRTCVFFFFQAEDGIRDLTVTGVQTCALPIYLRARGGLRPRQGGVVAGDKTAWGVGSGTWRCGPRFRPAPRGTTPHSPRCPLTPSLPRAGRVHLRRRGGGPLGVRDLERVPAP